MSKYKGIEILDMSDKSLLDLQFELIWLQANRDNRLREAKECHKVFDFQTINPAFIKIQNEVNEELKLRKARG